MSKNELIWGVFGGNINENVKAEILQNFDDDLQKRLIFTGFRNDIANVIKGMDVFIFPSHTEGLPTALLEAMALSRPIIAFDIAPMNELLAQNRGICVKFLDTNALSDAIRLYLKDENLCKQNGKNAAQYVKQNYDLSNLKENMKKLLEQL
ncbi:MAG: glycosyltransferase family 4 protein [Campylobacter sp.]